MKLSWATVATALMAVSAAMNALSYGWAHNVASATIAAGMSITGAYVYTQIKK